MKTKLFNNLLLKILSVIAAVVLWLVVLNIDDAVESIPIRGVKVSVINTESVTSQGQTYRVEEGTDTVDLVVYARRSARSKLKASDFVATADMSKDLRYNSMIDIKVKYTGDQDIDLNRIVQSRNNVQVSIEEQVTEQFKVTVRQVGGDPGNGRVVGSMIPEKSLVEITGPSSIVQKIKSVVAKVNVVGVTGTSTISSSLTLLNGADEEIDDTYLQYAGKGEPFAVTVTTLETKLVGISFDVSQVAAEGYGMSAITYKPETVTVAGEKSRLAGLYNLEIPPEALNPDKQTGHVEQTVDISQYLPDGITIPKEEEREIVVTMDIVPYETVSYSIQPGQITFDGIAEGLILDDTELQALEVPVSALPDNLAELDQSSIQVTADLSGCTRAGSYTVPVEVVLPDGYSCTAELTMDVSLVRAEEQE